MAQPSLRGPETMTSRERVRCAFAQQEPDRVPVGYSANPGIDRRLKAYFGLGENDDEGLLRVLGVDYRGTWVPYTGPRLHAEVPGRGVDALWGIRTRWVEHESGGYWDYCDFPLAGADAEQAAAWPMPNPDHFDYSGVREYCRRQQALGLALHVGDAGLGDVINATGMMRGVAETMMDLLTDDSPALILARRRNDINREVTRRTIEAAGGAIDFLWMGEDLGTQHAPLVSVATYRRRIRPIHQQFVDLAKAFDLPVIVHTCGASSWAYEDFIAMGIKGVDTLQPECTNMAPAYLKRTYGGRLAFHGCISTGGPVAFGTVADVERVCRETLDIMMPGGGYLFAPTHCLQDNSPVENVVAMYRTAHTHGFYRR
jgi:uroporphyrinogen decarboxylase